MYSSYEQRALDELEDAREELATYKRGMRAAITAEVLSVAAIVVGAWFSNYAFGVALQGFGWVAVFITPCFGAWWFWFNHSCLPDGGICRKPCASPAARCRQAERAHRDSVMRGA